MAADVSRLQMRVPGQRLVNTDVIFVVDGPFRVRRRQRVGGEIGRVNRCLTVDIVKRKRPVHISVLVSLSRGRREGIGVELLLVPVHAPTTAQNRVALAEDVPRGAKAGREINRWR